MKLKISSQNIFIGACALIIFGMLYSRFLISIGMIFFLIAALFDGDLKNKFLGFIKQKQYLAITGIFLIFFISGLWSENTDYFLNRIRIKLPIFFLPFAFYAAPHISKRIMQQILLGFIGIIAVSALWSTGLFLTDLEHYTAIYGKGQILPTPIHHVRYSIMVSLAVAMIIYILKSKQEIGDVLKKTLLIIGVLLVIYLHVLAVRSGLLTLYVALFAWLIFYIKEKKQILKAVGVTVISFILLGLATQYVPTIKKKIGYMRYSLDLFAKNENIRDLSDSRRLGSIFAGIQLTKDNLLKGVGIGDIMDETNRYLEKHYPDLTDLELLPHNQYILSSATLGILGLILFVIFSLAPLFYINGYDDYFIFSTQLMFYASFMVEHTIESQIGVALYIFITLFAMKNRASQTTEQYE